ncbi:hypothetical protein JKP88DRAFT_4828 [Tribonema minus]|uniref:Uncharacterized protein n=1 Tax=Tribonema minus TaxID=303371 RepID=A0A835ZGB1_9STRA|nr:hypothetical protein JKP88DRAFT_4828 [Tribonema minus]
MRRAAARPSSHGKVTFRCPTLSRVIAFVVIVVLCQHQCDLYIIHGLHRLSLSLSRARSRRNLPPGREPKLAFIRGNVGNDLAALDRALTSQCSYCPREPPWPLYGGPRGSWKGGSWGGGGVTGARTRTASRQAA